MSITGKKYAQRLAILCVVVLTLSTNVIADDDIEPVITVTLVGTGTPVPNPRQGGPAVLVEAAGEKLLFDCGRGCASTLWNLDRNHLRETHHLFLTHMHSDHTVGTADLYMNGWNLGRTAELQVYGPAAAEDFMRHLRLAFEEDVVFRAEKHKNLVAREALSHKVHPVENGTEIQIGEVTVTAFAVDHGVIEPAFGYRVDAGKHSVVISGDTAYSENLVESSTGADVLIHEVFSPALERRVRQIYPEEVADSIVAIHTLAPDVGRVFQASGTRVGVLTHFDNNPNALSELRDQVRTTWDGQLVIGEDRLIIEIGNEIRIHGPSSGN